MIPRATYRLQLGGNFGFAAAADLIPYLHDLSVSHCYLSPYLKARTGSPHGYDIVDHNDINGELGDWPDFQTFVTTLRAHDMGHILDLVTNHMGVGCDNEWWLDVLEHGRASRYAGYFDIDWYPLKHSLRERVLAPFLNDYYGKVLERGELVLNFDDRSGDLSVHYGEHRFPIDARTYPLLLSRHLKRLEQRLGSSDMRLLEFKTLVSALGHLPLRTETAPDKIEERRHSALVYRQQLAQLCIECPEIGEHLAANVTAVNGRPDRPKSFSALHRLLESQAYRLAYWRVASDEINYRRFFDVNDLAALRMENPEVFEATHRLVLELVRSGQLDGLRLDHPDGLYDPFGYYRRLVAALARTSAEGKEESDTRNPPIYLVAEKILAPQEPLPAGWPLHGTTGYDFANEVNGLFVHPQAERTLGRIYRQFTGRHVTFDETLYEAKRLAVEVQLFGELATLGNLLDRFAQSDRTTRDFTANSLRNALKEVVSCFPVYRTYIREGAVTEQDRQVIDRAVALAKRRQPAAEVSVFDFIRKLLLEGPCDPNPQRRAEASDFVMRFQQYTAPVAAKAMEDTSLYIDNRLVSLNEVGGDPRRFGLSLDAFHGAVKQRLQRWPATMLATSTHDSKRSEDVRARLNVLSEIPDDWNAHLKRWSRINRPHRRVVEHLPAPSRNDEYLLYQTLLGTWPSNPPDIEGLTPYRERINAYMLKAIREAKLQTSWINPNQAYEDAVAGFVTRLLDEPGNAFLRVFAPFATRVTRLGYFNSLSQTLLKLTTPGVPDIYQGCELWDFSLVDPDNRRPVDFRLRRELLESIKRGAQTNLRGLLKDMTENLQDGRLKLFLIYRVLEIRRRMYGLFEGGDYLPLSAEGQLADHLCAFARTQGKDALIVIAPRWFAGLCGTTQQLPVGQRVWNDTCIVLPQALADRRWLNLLDGSQPRVTKLGEGAALPVRDLMTLFPVGLLGMAPEAGNPSA